MPQEQKKPVGKKRTWHFEPPPPKIPPWIFFEEPEISDDFECPSFSRQLQQHNGKG
jgi:hypothetical protein